MHLNQAAEQNLRSFSAEEQGPGLNLQLEGMATETGNEPGNQAPLNPLSHRKRHHKNSKVGLSDEKNDVILFPS